MAQKLNICHVITRMIVGGAQENTLLSAKGQVEHGHQVVLVTGPSPGPEGRLLDRETVPGLEVVTCPSLVRPLHPWRDWLAYRELTELFRACSFDVVHTHSSKAGIIGRFAARKAAVPLVVHTVHGQAFHPYQSRLKNALYITAERMAARRCDRIFAVAQAMIDQCVAARVAPAEKYKVVYSGMDMESFLTATREQELRERLDIPADALVVGKIARLFELKGHDCLIEAARLVVEQIPNVIFLLVGDGDLRDRLQAMIARYGLSEHFRFAGLVAPREVPRYTAQMDILAHLSWREGLPRTVVQALAAGIPAVGFALDGTPEVIIENETGHLCTPGDVAGVASAIVDLLADREKRQRFGAAGRARVREQFSWHRMCDVLENEYFEGLARLGKTR